MKKTLLFLLCTLACSGAFAEDKAKPIVVASTAQAFAQTETQIRQQMESGGRFEFIKPTDKVTANSDLDAMMAMLQKSGSVDAMNAGDKVHLLNLQEHLNGVLTHNDSERLVCERNNPLGSHIASTTCRTYGEIERNRQQTQKFLDQNERHNPSLTHGN
jgi:ABC-type metal ion transport system substrate-binding protein